jgi:hypothetical protein
MTIKARFTTSIGDVFLFFNDKTLAVIDVENPELIRKLYRVWKKTGIDRIEKMDDDSLWAFIDLEDANYGQPEYRLEVSS